MEGSTNGDGGPWSRYCENTTLGSGSCSSSGYTSGTIVSTAYTSNSSRLSSFSMGAAIQLDMVALDEDRSSWIETEKNDAKFDPPIKKPRHSSNNISMEAALQLELREGTSEPDKEDAQLAQPTKKPRVETKETFKEKSMKHIKSLVQQFFRALSANRSRSTLGSDGGMNALESWFWELGVSWVLQLDVGASARRLGYDTGGWIRALAQIMETISLTESFFRDHGHGFVGMPSISEENGDTEGGKHAAATSLHPVQFALFVREAMSKMLVFVDVMFSESLPAHELPYNSSTFHSCLSIYTALSEALSGIRLQFHSWPPADVEKIEKEMVSLLSAKQGKAFEAIWSALEESRTRVPKSMEDSLATQTPQGSSDIHHVTCSVMLHISILLRNHREFDPLVSQAASLGKYVPQSGFGEAPPFTSLITEMVSCLEEKLITKSQLFLDKGLGLLFLLNNSNFIRDFLQNLQCTVSTDLAAIISFITPKVEHYTESYIKVSWEPMLACLFNPTPLRLVRKYSPPPKFESEFQKTYAIQKLRRVPNPELRKRLRKAVIKKIIPGYTRYIEDNKVTNPRFNPQELEEMLQELFEG